MLTLRRRVAAGAIVVSVVAVVAAGHPASGQSGSGEKPKPNVVPHVEPRFEIPAAPWAGSGSAASRPGAPLWGGSSIARRLGVTLRELAPAEATERRLPMHSGVLVESVLPQSAAAKAGLRVGDVILQINGEHARSIAQVRRLVNETPAGHAASLTVFRDGKSLPVSVTPDAANPDLYLFGPDARRGLEDLQRELRQGGRSFFWAEPPEGQRNPWQYPDLTPGAPFGPRWPLFEWSPGADRLGIVVQGLSSQLAEYFKVKGGVLVASVTAESPAKRAGLKAGDVITAVNRKDVNAPNDLLQMIRNMKDGEDVSLSIVRSGAPMTITVKLGNSKGAWHVHP